jgi:hypothetical protein
MPGKMVEYELFKKNKERKNYALWQRKIFFSTVCAFSFNHMYGQIGILQLCHVGSNDPETHSNLCRYEFEKCRPFAKHGGF